MIILRFRRKTVFFLLCMTLIVFVTVISRFQKSSISRTSRRGYALESTLQSKQYFLRRNNGGKDMIELYQFPLRGLSLPIVVVEEHHEVLLHWYTGVKTGVVNGNNNLLIHIDGHSDAGPPIFFEGYPQNFKPRTVEDMKTMIQRNDVFVQEVALSGLINHFIWIWPKWDGENHDTVHDSGLTFLGVVDTLYEELDNTHVKSACMCETDDGISPTQCVSLNITADFHKNGTTIDPKTCQIKTKIILESIREDVALEMARNGSLFEGMGSEDKSRILLDIDEDFYGCESAVQPLLDQKMEMATVKHINSFVDALFCPTRTANEAEIDEFISNTISAVIREKECSNSATCGEEMEAILDTYTDKVVSGNEILLKRGLCRQSKKSRKRKWKDLISILKAASLKQLKELRELGFCFRTTPKAYDFGDENDDIFRVCHGANTPDDSIVNYHTPSEKDIENRTNLLRSFLLATKKTLYPSMVTVCRSMRDGYTSRKHFHRIEKDVLKSLKETFPQSNVLYDLDLLGGIHGWPSRHKYTDPDIHTRK